MKSLTNPIIHAWQWWFTPRSTDPTVRYREQALRVLLPIVILLRILGTTRNFSGLSDLPKPYDPLWVNLAFFIVPLIFSIYFLVQQKVDWAGAFFILHWYLIDMLSLPAEGYWYPGFQISLIMQVVLGTLLLPARAILPFMIFQLTTVGIWGHWLDVNYFDPPLLSSGQPVAVFERAFLTLAAQESIIVFIVRYLRMQMEGSLRLQQVNIKQLEAEIEERHHAETALRMSEARYRNLLENIPAITYINGLEPSNPTTYVGPQVEKLSGYSSAEFINTPELWSNLIHPDDRARVMAESERTNQTGERFVIDYRIITKEKKSVWLNDEAVLVKDGNGKPLYWLGIWSDISERKSAELKAMQHARQLATIIEIGHAVSTLRDLNTILEIIYQQIQLIAQVDSFFISLYDADTNQLSFPLTYDMGIRYDEPGGEMSPGTRLAKVIHSGQPYHIHRTVEEVAEAEKDERGVGNAQRKSASLLFVPLWQANQVIGVLSIQSYTLNAYPDELVETLAGIGNQAAIAIQNARLFTSVQQELTDRKSAEEKIRQAANQLAMFNEISRAVAELTDLDSVLEIVRRQLEKLLKFDSYSVRIFNEDTHTVTYLAVYESGRYWDEPESALEPETHAYQVFKTGESILHLITDAEMEKYRRGLYNPIGDHSKSTTSLIFVPLKRQGKTIGVLSLQRYEPNSYTPGHLDLVEAVAIHVAIAIENARLFESLQRELQERIRTEELREKLIGELEQKNAELERFTYTVSHDLKSPLVTIKGFLGMLKKDLKENNHNHIQKDFERIAEAADKMGILLSDLLELSRIGHVTNPPEEVNTVKLTHDALETLDGRIRERHVKVTISPDLPIVYADRNRLREVLENLIDNAAKYMGDQASPLIEVCKRESKAETIICVKDNGIGIEPRFHAKIFGLFEKLNAHSEGSGIGLALIKRIIEVHGGKIWVESEGLGKGSTFCFTIPDKQG